MNCTFWKTAPDRNLDAGRWVGYVEFPPATDRRDYQSKDRSQRIIPGDIEHGFKDLKGGFNLHRAVIKSTRIL